MWMNFLVMAEDLSRDGFVSACDFPFLFGATLMVTPGQSGPRTILREMCRTPIGAEPESVTPKMILQPVRCRGTPTDRITVGRTPDNDVFLADVQVSKLHAYFQELDGQLLLFDAGSRNGTWVGDRPLVPNGPGVPVPYGTMVRFSSLCFTLLDPAGAWQSLREVRASVALSQ
jgi:hypothetical protein